MIVKDLFLPLSIGFFFAADSAFDFFFADRVEVAGSTGLDRVFIVTPSRISVDIEEGPE